MKKDLWEEIVKRRNSEKEDFKFSHSAGNAGTCSSANGSIGWRDY
jgi:hypothetical protein